MAEMNNQNENRKSVRGFAAMDSEKQKEIARKGGRAAHEQGVAHEWSSEEARAAGKKGGQARGKNLEESEPLL
jgi:general stress protein YciG